MHMDSLPAEIALKILWNLSPLDLCRLSQVNKFWYYACQEEEIWSYFCNRRFGINNLTFGEYNKLLKRYPNALKSWKDWYSFRSQFRRDVAGSISIEILEYSDGTKRNSSKSIYGEFVCHSYEPQYSNKQPFTFNFDEYHTIISGEIYALKAFSLYRVCLGRVILPLFQFKRKETILWVGLDEDQDENEDVWSPRAKKLSKNECNEENLFDSIPTSLILSNPLKTSICKKHVLLRITLNPVPCTIQDFVMIASVSRGISNSYVESLFVRDKDTNRNFFMKILPINEGLFDYKDVSVSYSPVYLWDAPDHPFLVEMYTTFHANMKIFALMEWIGGDVLISEMRRAQNDRLPEDIARFYIAQVAIGIRYLHQNQIIYRDLKPENILLTKSGYCKITQKIPEWFYDYKGSIGSSQPEHLAPEIIKNMGYTYKVDWWSVGTILYQMLVGYVPFYHPNVQTMYGKILEDQLRLPSYLSEEACTLLKGLINKDPKKRFGFKRLRNSSFFQGFEWDKLINQEIEPPLKPFKERDIKIASNGVVHGLVRESPPPSRRNLLL